MGSKYKYQRVISNTYLNDTKAIVAATRAELELKIAQQYAKWQELEAKKRKQDSWLSLEARTARNTEEAQARLSALRELLVRGLKLARKYDWAVEKNYRPYPPLGFRESPPTWEQAAQSLGISPQKPLTAHLLPGLMKKREMDEAKIRERLSVMTMQYEARKAEALRTYEEKRHEYEQARARYNASIDQKQKRFEEGDAEVVIWFLKRTIDNIGFPEGYGKDVEVAFDPLSGTAVISMQLPNTVELPRISSYKFVKSRGTIDTVEMKPKEFDTLYDSLIHQITLLTIHRCFYEAYTPSLTTIVFNGWVTGVNRSTGNEFTSCIISVQAARKDFQAINLERVDPRECVRSLKGIIAGSLSQLAPVRPIMELDTFDKRFVESREVLANLNSTNNLATMDWEDFEHLVRELFSKIFEGYGSEVHVTQASRDGGVDAVAFDPDPIRGGKYVIQAKRYNKVVPVSAVRDLYGTMINEGAVKGILVTTSHYGSDSREFVKDKPITLIDGANLAYLFQQHGYKVRIELQQ